MSPAAKIFFPLISVAITFFHFLFRRKVYYLKERDLLRELLMKTQETRIDMIWNGKSLPFSSSFCSLFICRLYSQGLMTWDDVLVFWLSLTPCVCPLFLLLLIMSFLSKYSVVWGRITKYLDKQARHDRTWKGVAKGSKTRTVLQWKKLFEVLRQLRNTIHRQSIAREKCINSLDIKTGQIFRQNCVVSGKMFTYVSI